MAKYFSEDEFRCKGDECGCHNSLPEDGIHPLLFILLDVVREKVGQPVSILSGYRCETHNANVGGAPNSYRCQGVAADLYTTNIDVEAFAQLVEQSLVELGIEGGVGRYPSQSFVHADVRGYTARWDESNP